MQPDPYRGLAATRYLKSLIVANGYYADAEAYARSQGWHNVSEVIAILRAAQTALGTSDTTALRPAGNDILSLVRPREIISRLPGVRRIPFDVSLSSFTTGTSGNWEGEGKPIPVSKAAFASPITLPRRKVSSLAVIDEELARSSSPSAESALSTDFARGLLVASDSAFIDPSNAGIAGVKPAAVTNGAPAFAISANTPAAIDAGVQSMVESILAAGSTLEYVAAVMHPASAASLASVRGTGGARAYPDISAKGGSLNGLPVVTSSSVPWGLSPHLGYIALVDGSRVWLADDGEVQFDISKETALQLLDNPTNDVATPTATTLVSLYQTASVALRSQRWMNWKISAAGFAAVATCPF